MHQGLSFIFVVVGLFSLQSLAEPLELYCSLRKGESNLDCQIAGKDRKTMTPDDISNFVDSAQTKAYIVVKSKKGKERVFLVDSQAPQFKKLADLKSNAAASVIARAKSDLFDEIEKRVIQISDEMDTASAQNDLIISDSSTGYDKFKLESNQTLKELEGYRKSRESVCTATPAYEQLTKSRAALQQTLSNLLYAFQTPSTCLSDFKVFKDSDGSVDLRQLDGLAASYKAQCKK